MATTFDNPARHNLRQSLLLWGWLLSWCLMLAAAFWLLSLFYNLFVTLVLSLFLTYLLLSPVNGLETVLSRLFEKLIRLKWLGRQSRYQWVLPKPRVLAVLVVYLLFFLLLLLGASRGFPRLKNQLNDLTLAIPSYVAQAQEWLTTSDEPLLRFIPKPVMESLPLWRSGELVGAKPHTEKSKEEATLNTTLDPTLNTTLSKTEENTSLSAAPETWLMQSLNTALDKGMEFLGITLNRFIYFIALVVFTFYFLLDGRKLQSRLAFYSPKAWKKLGEPLFLYTHDIMQAYIRGQVSLALLTGVYMSIVFSVFHVKYALLLGLWFTVAELFPVIGTWLGILPSLLVAFLSGGLWVMLSVWGCSYAYQTIKDNVLAPKITGQAMGLHPLGVIISLLLGAKLGGFIGILLALPAAGLLKALVEHRKRPSITGFLEKHAPLLPPSSSPNSPV